MVMDTRLEMDFHQSPPELEHTPKASNGPIAFPIAFLLFQPGSHYKVGREGDVIREVKKRLLRIVDVEMMLHLLVRSFHISLSKHLNLVQL